MLSRRDGIRTHEKLSHLPPRATLFMVAAVTSAMGVAVFAFGASGADKPPAQVAGSVRGFAAPTGTTSASLKDSALEPAALAAAKAEDWPRAESLYRELGRRQPRNPAAKRGLGNALVHQQKGAEAIAALEDALRLGDDVETRLALASAYASVGRHPSALPHLRKAVQMAPRDSRAWTALADTLVKVEKPDGAADVLQDSRKACSACAGDAGWNRVADDVARGLAARADKQVASGDASHGRKSADLAATLRPNLPETNLVMGKIARAEGDKKAAASAYRKAVEGFPDAKAEPGAAARLELATLLIGDGGGAEAKTLAEQVIAARGDDGPALDTLGRACDATRDAACARQAYGKLVKLPAGGLPNGALEHAKLRMKELKGRK